MLVNVLEESSFPWGNVPGGGVGILVFFAMQQIESNSGKKKNYSSFSSAHLCSEWRLHQAMNI